VKMNIKHWLNDTIKETPKFSAKAWPCATSLSTSLTKTKISDRTGAYLKRHIILASNIYPLKNKKKNIRKACVSLRFRCLRHTLYYLYRENCTVLLITQLVSLSSLVKKTELTFIYI
jgi:hypothetical protein